MGKGDSGKGWQTKGTAEKAVLVGVEFSRRRVAPKAAEAKRASQDAGLRLEALEEILAERSELSIEEPERGAPVENPLTDERFEEFRELVESAGATVVAEIVQRRQAPDPATLIGMGKVEEVEGAAASSDATVIIFDYDLSPTQLRNLEARLPCRVIDRTQLILDIFARHARTREGQLQVELAQLEYMLPRLTGKGKAMSQLGGGIGTRGPGETKLETDRRRIQRRLLQLKKDLDDVRKTRRLQRSRRESVPVPTVALVGYTNAGKSTLFNCLTEAGVLESSRMFATLDPKLRSIVLPSRRKILLSDTVGFIRDLPHTLVTSFRATLEEVVHAELLLHVRDAASPRSEEQRQQVTEVLRELEVASKPVLEVLNKVDLLAESDRRAHERRGDLLVSGLSGAGAAELLRAIDRALTSDPVRLADLLIPQSEGAVLAAVESGAVIEERNYAGEAVQLRVAAPESLLARYRQFEVGYVPVAVERPKRRVQKTAKPEAEDAEV